MSPFISNFNSLLPVTTVLVLWMYPVHPCLLRTVSVVRWANLLDALDFLSRGVKPDRYARRVGF